MRLSFQNERVQAVVAHPDDAELLCAGTLARARDEGAAIAICVMCRGDKGQPAKKIKDLATVRQKEMQAAAKLLGAELYTLGHGDGTLTDTPETRLPLIDTIRAFKPTLVMAHAPNDYHPDHRAASAIAEAATWLCASRGHETQHAALEAPPALWWMDTVAMSGFEPTIYVDVSQYAELKQQMLACHKSQLERRADGDFAPLEDVMRTQLAARGLQAGVAAAEAFRGHTSFKRGRAW